MNDWNPPNEDETNRVFYDVFTSAFRDFVKKDLPSRLCSDWFYLCINTRFGFIAHNDCNGFIKEYFTCTKDKIRFVEKILAWNGHGLPMDKS